MSQEDNAYERRAVLVSITKEDGGLRLCLDDAKQKSHTDHGVWIQREHYTSKIISEDVFDSLSFDDKELADFGYAILARLHAFKSRGEI